MIGGRYTRTQNWGTSTYWLNLKSYPRLRCYDIYLKCIFVKGFVCSFLAFALKTLGGGYYEKGVTVNIFDEIWDQCQVNL